MQHINAAYAQPVHPSTNFPTMIPPTPTTVPTPLAVVEYLLNQLPPLPPLNKDDHQDVQFWEKRMWEQWVSEGKESGDTFKSGVRGEGINSSWMEDSNGIRVNVSRQGEIINGARRVWTTLSSNGVLLRSYRGIQDRTLTYFRRAVETEFEELRLCSNHWKTDKLWKENFSPRGNDPNKGTSDADKETSSQGSGFTKVSAFHCDLPFCFSCTFSSSLSPPPGMGESCKTFLARYDHGF